MLLLDFCNAIMDGKIETTDANFLYNGVIYYCCAQLSSRRDKTQMIKCWKQVEGDKSDYCGLYNRREFFIRASKNIIPVEVFTVDDSQILRAVMRISDRKIIWYCYKWYL